MTDFLRGVINAPAMLPVAAVVFAAVVVLLLVGRRGDRRAAAALAVLALAWIVVNKPMEGMTLWRIGDDRGLTQADLLAPVALLVAALRAVRPRREAKSARAAERLSVG